MTHDEAYRRYFPIIRTKVFRILGSGAQAEEVAQETFLRFWREGPRDASIATTTAWLYRTATRMAIDAVRRHSLALRHRTLGDVVTPPTGLHGLQLDELVKHVEPRSLEAALLHRVDGLSQAEVAEVLGITTRSVRRLLTRFDEMTLEIR
ncbi:MAG: RNA polymerase sigma factor [Myxococcota bacterium]